MGSTIRGTIFDNIANVSACFLGISERTVRRLNSDVIENGEQEDEKKKTKKEKMLALLSDNQKNEITAYIFECYEKERNFTLSSLLEALQENFNFPFGRTTLHGILKAMNLSYKLKTYNPFASSRDDIARWRAWYLSEIYKLRVAGAYITYFDETWLFHGMTNTRGWLPKNSTAYEIARLGNLKNPVPGFAAASDKGKRATVLAILTESGVLHESIDVIVSDRPPAEQLVDYHATMDANMYEQYMENVLPALLASTPPGRQPILVIDNASTHNGTEHKLPTQQNRKADLIDFLEEKGVALGSDLLKTDVYAEVESYIDRHGGRKRLTKYKVDERASSMGIRIIRTPPYHCCLSPIELVWGQLKSYLRKTGKTTDKVEMVRERAINFLKNIKEEFVAATYEHIIDVENDIRHTMEQARMEDFADEIDELLDDELPDNNNN
ncbi:hypothetical protein GCK72_007324 [Caenorhabditis remanei]|uniref:Tc1-like transposase DDE domain-containing protein n=1 Tax=Caenorhabditis remanei TaxID=31234 RepID=A0A6A5HIS2_CAERE|nr:hypothetical protein GCK72_007323 [Caenorhabditis remanei]XP_053590306.1 hypothetical protein GCK72_007324 [Caenorhabditis remanei]KAF1767364.1 hypothetical protein GCK72_007323 [Caenorhabditis remanei]KAF1767365.1 hypothetical protein GCK72_007324 [Caenorhabditis remanei]